MKLRKTIDLEGENVGEDHLCSFTVFQSPAQNGCFLIIIKEIACDNELLPLPHSQQFLSEHFVICLTPAFLFRGSQESTVYLVRKLLLQN